MSDPSLIAYFRVYLCGSIPFRSITDLAVVVLIFGNLIYSVHFDPDRNKSTVRDTVNQVVSRYQSNSRLPQTTKSILRDRSSSRLLSTGGPSFRPNNNSHVSFSLTNEEVNDDGETSIVPDTSLTQNDAITADGQIINNNDDNMKDGGGGDGDDDVEQPPPSSHQGNNENDNLRYSTIKLPKTSWASFSLAMPESSIVEEHHQEDNVEEAVEENGNVDGKASVKVENDAQKNAAAESSGQVTASATTTAATEDVSDNKDSEQ